MADVAEVVQRLSEAQDTYRSAVVGTLRAFAETNFPGTTQVTIKLKNTSLFAGAKFVGPDSTVEIIHGEGDPFGLLGPLVEIQNHLIILGENVGDAIEVNF